MKRKDNDDEFLNHLDDTNTGTEPRDNGTTETGTGTGTGAGVSASTSAGRGEERISVDAHADKIVEVLRSKYYEYGLHNTPTAKLGAGIAGVLALLFGVSVFVTMLPSSFGTILLMSVFGVIGLLVFAGFMVLSYGIAAKVIGRERAFTNMVVNGSIIGGLVLLFLVIESGVFSGAFDELVVPILAFGGGILIVLKLVSGMGMAGGLSRAFR